jgi:tetratricopeptide (TPR) repeat protein
VTLTTGLLAVLAATAVPQASTRIPVPPEVEEAFGKREYGKAAGILIPAFDNCRAQNPTGDACAELAKGVAVLVATAGNDKVEDVILRAQAYIDTNVGRDSVDALAMLGAVTSYYDRLTNLPKYMPVVERRVVLARKLFGPTARVSAIAAVSLCVGQWSTGQGRAAVDLLMPIAGKLPETTRQEQILSGRVYECLGNAYRSMDRPREAEPEYRKALAVFERAEGEGGDLSVDVMASLASVLRQLDREDEARLLAARIDKLAKPGSSARERIAWWFDGDAADPVAAARANLAKAEKQYGATSVGTDMEAGMLALALIDAGKFAEAEPYMQRLAAAAENEANPAAVRIKLMMGQVVAVTKTDPKRLDLIVPVVERLISLAKQSGRGTDKLLIDFQMYAGTALLLNGQAARAYPFLDDAGDLLLQRLATYRDFDAAAQKETREYAPIFKFKVATAWTLARGR